MSRRPQTLVELNLRPFIEKKIKMEKMEDCYRNLLQNIGEDPNREGLLKTPKRLKLYKRYNKQKLNVQNRGR